MVGRNLCHVTKNPSHSQSHFSLFPDLSHDYTTHGVLFHVIGNHDNIWKTYHLFTALLLSYRCDSGEALWIYYGRIFLICATSLPKHLENLHAWIHQAAQTHHAFVETSAEHSVMTQRHGLMLSSNCLKCLRIGRFMTNWKLWDCWYSWSTPSTLELNKNASRRLVETFLRSFSS